MRLTLPRFLFPLGRFLGVVPLLALGMGAVQAQDAERSGVLVELWTDPLPTSGREPSVGYFLVEEGGRWVGLEVPAAAEPITGLRGRRVTVSGFVVPGRGGGPGSGGSIPTMRVASIQEDEVRPGTRPAGQPEGAAAVRRYVTVLCRFPGSPDEEARSPDTYRSWMGAAPPGMGHYWNALSRGYLEFYGETVAGWYDLPGPIEAYFEDPAPQERVQPDWGLLARDCSALADAEVDFATVDGINLQFNVKFGAAWGGSSVLALDGEPRTFGVTWMPTWSSQSVYGHEIGHTFGLPHSSGPYEQTYDSRWDVMSDGNTVWDDQLQTAIGQHTIAFHRELLGWDPQGRIFVADRFGVSDTVALEFWNQEGGAGWSTIKIPLYNGIHYTAEARRQAGYDSGIPFRTVVLHHVDPGREDRRAQVVDADGNGNPNDAGAAWAPGETFRDGAQGVHLEVLEELTGRPGVDEGFLVAVTRGWWLDLILEGEGRVFSLVRDLECTASCSRLLVSRGPMLLQAEAGDGLAFAGWDGSCAGGGDCELTPSGRDSVVARFAEPLVILSDPHRPDATLGAWYEDELEFSGGTGITTWRMAGGAPPRGVGLDSLGGVLRGIPEESGDFEFLLTASSGALSSRDAFHLSVNRPEVSLREAIGELLERGSLLTLDETRFLDLVGNGNGRFDVGDVLLFRKNGGRP